MHLATADDLLPLHAALDAAWPTLTASYDPSLLDDPIAGPSLTRYLILTELPGAMAELDLTPEAIFWSRVYWFERFSVLRRHATGFDAGLEQQAHQLLEHPNPPCDPDWSHLEAIHTRAERDATAVIDGHLAP